MIDRAKPQRPRAGAEAPPRRAALSGDGAYEHVRTAIADGVMKPGERVRETELAERLGISRTPVREALRRLESDGLLAHEPHRGMVVNHLDHQAVTELYLMREVLEGTAAALASRHASDAEIAALRDMVEGQSAPHADAATHAQWNKVFHRALYLGAHNRYLLQMLNGLATSMSLLGRTTLSLNGRPQVAAQEHLRIVEAIAAHDPVAAEDAARHHIHMAHKARLKVMLEDEMADPQG